MSRRIVIAGFLLPISLIAFCGVTQAANAAPERCDEDRERDDGCADRDFAQRGRRRNE